MKTLSDITFEVGDIVEITDPNGAKDGEVGDRGRVVSTERQDKDWLVTIELLSGTDMGKQVTRYRFRYRFISKGEWEL